MENKGNMGKAEREENREEKREQKQREYCHIYLFNEALFGQSWEHLKTMEEEVQVNLKVDFSNYYVCRTGIPKKWYSTRLGINRNRFAEMFYTFQAQAYELLENCGYAGDMDVVNYDLSKQAAILFYPIRSHCSTAREVAEGISALWERTYRAEAGFETAGLANLTVLSPQLGSYEELAEAFARLSELGRLSFFVMEFMVLDQEICESIRRPCDFRQVLDLLSEWEQAFFDRQYGDIDAILRQLFCEKLKYSFDEGLCRRALDEIRSRFLYYNETFDHTMENEIRRLLRMENYACIEELEQAIVKLSREFLEGLPSNIHHLSGLSRRAIQFLRENYDREIGLNDLATELNVAPAYMSRVFNREVGVRIPTYLARVRMEKARQLLKDTDLKISEIARQVGIENIQYFNVLFKKDASVSPQEYRNMG